MNVEELLNSEGVPFIPKGKDYVISCLNPDHPDKNPSMRVDQITGIFNCFSCEFKGNLFTHFGLRPNILQMKRELLVRKIRDKRVESIGMAMPPNALPYLGDWRNIRPETYAKFEAFECYDAPFTGRIVFPLKSISGNIVGFNGRHTTGGIPKYLIDPVGAKLPIFPSKIEPINASVMLVEGIYDMLNLHDKGLTNAACCFGTKNINEDKLSLFRLQGVEHADIFFDGDDAGQKAAIKLKSMCENVGFTTRNVSLKDTDPGELSLPTVQKLKKRLYG